jgi:hypothetical protein
LVKLKRRCGKDREVELNRKSTRLPSKHNLPGFRSQALAFYRSGSIPLPGDQGTADEALVTVHQEGRQLRLLQFIENSGKSCRQPDSIVELADG